MPDYDFSIRMQSRSCGHNLTDIPCRCEAPDALAEAGTSIQRDSCAKSRRGAALHHTVGKPMWNDLMLMAIVSGIAKHNTFASIARVLNACAPWKVMSACDPLWPTWLSVASSALQILIMHYPERHCCATKDCGNFSLRYACTADNGHSFLYPQSVPALSSTPCFIKSVTSFRAKSGASVSARFSDLCLTSSPLQRTCCY